MTGKNNPHLINRVAEWKRTSIRLRRSGNLQAVCGKNGTVQTVIGGDAVNFTVMLTGGTTFGIAQARGFFVLSDNHVAPRLGSHSLMSASIQSGLCRLVSSVAILLRNAINGVS